MGTNKKQYDLVVIGGGSAGLTAAKFAATFDKSAVIIEKAKLGGDCTWFGCLPSKTLISCANAAHEARNAAKFGVLVGDVKVDWNVIKDNIKSTQEHIYEEDDSPEAMKALGIDTIEGRAELQTSNTLKVYSADNSVIEIHAKDGVVIATGASAVKPNIEGIDNVKYFTYESIFDLDELPKTMTIVGGGPVGAELTQAFARLGVSITLIAPRLLPREDADVSAIMEEVFADEGINIVKGRAVRVEPSGDGHIVTVSTASGESILVRGDLLMASMGRQPTVHGMGLESLGVKINSLGGIEIDEKLRTSVKNIYAAGDCTGDKQFTHYAGYQGAVAARNALLPFTDPGVMTDDVPATYFTSPEVASVGLSEEEAILRFGQESVAVSKQMVKNIDRALCAKKTAGFIKIVYLKKNYSILGATIVAPTAGEMISEIGVVMKSKMKFDTLATVMHSYPSFAFALQVMAAEVYYAKLGKLKGLLSFLKKIGF